MFHWVLQARIPTASLDLAGQIIGITSVKMGLYNPSVKLKAAQEVFDI